MGTDSSVLLDKEEGQTYWVLGDLYTFKVTGKQTNGAFTVVDQTIQPNGGPPPHIHLREDESFYVLDGKFSFLYQQEERVLETGAFAYIPKGVVHTFKNISDTPGRLLLMISPAGLEEFFYRIGTPITESATPPAFNPEMFDKLVQLAKEHHMEIILPERTG